MLSGGQSNGIARRSKVIENKIRRHSTLHLSQVVLIDYHLLLFTPRCEGADKSARLRLNLFISMRARLHLLHPLRPGVIKVVLSISRQNYSTQVDSATERDAPERGVRKVHPVHRVDSWRTKVIFKLTMRKTIPKPDISYGPHESTSREGARTEIYALETTIKKRAVLKNWPDESTLNEATAIKSTS